MIKKIINPIVIAGLSSFLSGFAVGCLKPQRADVRIVDKFKDVD